MEYTSKILYLRTYKNITMNTKLTLKLNQEIIERAKQYAILKKMSLSRLIENYLSTLTSEKSEGSTFEISPFVKSLSSNSGLPANFDYKNERGDYLEQKYE